MSTDCNGNNTTTQGIQAGVSRRNIIKLTGAGAAAIGLSSAAGLAGAGPAFAAPTVSPKDLEPGDTSNGADNFYTSNQVTLKKISLKNK